MPKTTRRLTVHPMSLREVEVTRIEDITPGLRRVVLGGDELGAFTSSNGLPQPAFRSDGFDDAIRLVFPYPGRTDPVLPTQEPGHVDWPKSPRALSKVYTVREWDQRSGELTVDFVKHGTGVATTWAYRASTGDRVHLVSPPASAALPVADWLLVVGDDTALPAIARLLDELPDDARAQVFIEISLAEHRIPLRELPGVEVTWLVRDGLPAGTTTLLTDAVRAADWWEGDPFAWIAGESTQVKLVRRHLVEDRGLAKDVIDFTGYWRLGEVITLEDDPAVPDPERNEEAFEKLHELAELAPPLAIRAAVDLGLPELISRGVTGVGELAKQSSCDPVGVQKLLRYLHALELLEETVPGHYALTDAGDYLVDDFVLDVLQRDGYFARRSLAFHGIEHSVRTGGESYTSVTGQSYADLSAEPWYEDRALEQISDFGRYLAEPLAQSPTVQGFPTVTVRSEGAGVMASAIVAAVPEARVTIADLPSRVAWFRGDLATSVADEEHLSRIDFVERSLFETAPATDAVLIVKELGRHRHDDAVHVLRRAAAGLTDGGALLVVEDILKTDELDEHEVEADLQMFTLYGTGIRTEEELLALFADAGLRVHSEEPVGWGFRMFRVVPV
ncbi:siderophore-interacting protein [Microbacterium sp. No. 7]|uniref:siderophore-interacting protein n=1 Tax=Microbacterium sp. No. 7 TaxID=1714373 RepID=UPI0006D266F5|nr:siderophore-interacting protein [Microbacterium sp. No. 7]ALJ18951.1 phage tail protein [Microbacterium sp. No. 7]